MLEKHAYLILAHKSDYVLNSLLRLIDDERNDIFIHMDKRNRKYNESKTCSVVKKATIKHCERWKCAWGGYSLVKAELSLLELATKSGNYSYYHLLSGQDLPIKSQDEIHNFFTSNYGKEFVRFDSQQANFTDRVRIYHFFQEILGHHKNTLPNRLFLSLQKKVGITRNKSVIFKKGPQWFSITDGFARFLIQKRTWINQIFKYTFCPDEFFVQTVLYNSQYLKSQYLNDQGDCCGDIARHIDWERGTPYVFRKCDFEELINSTKMFARKFDADIDMQIIQMLNETM